MSALASMWVKLETLKQMVQTLEKKQVSGVELTIAIDDKSKEFDGKEGKKIYQNVSCYVAQTKEQRDAKAAKYYVGNGGVFWHTDTIHKAGPSADQQAAAPSPQPGANTPHSQENSADDLPF